MAPYNNLTGQQFGKLYVIGDTGKRRYKKVVWLCKCECGNTREVVGSFLTTGKVCECKRCAKITHQGCAGKQNLRHSLNNTYYHMKERCEDPNCEAYPYYGGRGISICKEWSEDVSKFREWALNNGYTFGLTIERIDVNGNYSPENCKLIPLREQFFNRRNTIYVYYREKKISLAKICYDLNLDWEKIHKYIKTNIKYMEKEG